MACSAQCVRSVCAVCVASCEWFTLFVTGTRYRPPCAAEARVPGQTAEGQESRNNGPRVVSSGVVLRCVFDRVKVMRASLNAAKHHHDTKLQCSVWLRWSRALLQRTQHRTHMQMAIRQCEIHVKMRSVLQWNLYVVKRRKRYVQRERASLHWRHIVTTKHWRTLRDYVRQRHVKQMQNQHAKQARLHALWRRWWRSLADTMARKQAIFHAEQSLKRRAFMCLTTALHETCIYEHEEMVLPRQRLWRHRRKRHFFMLWVHTLTLKTQWQRLRTQDLRRVARTALQQWRHVLHYMRQTSLRAHQFYHSHRRIDVMRYMFRHWHQQMQSKLRRRRSLRALFEEMQHLRRKLLWHRWVRAVTFAHHHHHLRAKHWRRLCRTWSTLAQSLVHLRERAIAFRSRKLRHQQKIVFQTLQLNVGRFRRIRAVLLKSLHEQERHHVWKAWGIWSQMLNLQICEQTVQENVQFSLRRNGWRMWRVAFASSLQFHRGCAEAVHWFHTRLQQRYLRCWRGFVQHRHSLQVACDAYVQQKTNRIRLLHFQQWRVCMLENHRGKRRAFEHWRGFVRRKRLKRVKLAQSLSLYHKHLLRQHFSCLRHITTRYRCDEREAVKWWEDLTRRRLLRGLRLRESIVQNITSRSRTQTLTVVWKLWYGQVCARSTLREHEHTLREKCVESHIRQRWKVWRDSYTYSRHLHECVQQFQKRRNGCRRSVCFHKWRTALSTVMERKRLHNLVMELTRLHLLRRSITVLRRYAVSRARRRHLIAEFSHYRAVNSVLRAIDSWREYVERRHRYGYLANSIQTRSISKYFAVWRHSQRLHALLQIAHGRWRANTCAHFIKVHRHDTHTHLHI